MPSGFACTGNTNAVAQAIAQASSNSNSNNAGTTAQAVAQAASQASVTPSVQAAAFAQAIAQVTCAPDCMQFVLHYGLLFLGSDARMVCCCKRPAESSGVLQSLKSGNSQAAATAIAAALSASQSGSVSEAFSQVSMQNLIDNSVIAVCTSMPWHVRTYPAGCVTVSVSTITRQQS